ncbi:ATP-binding protein [Anaeromicrobium sediminis]|uniref:histidine kinase n=1 Tax=Anaeromicrobium sediminis TaxID=1478221 RepID=A0A267MQ83_9FIRM|nr:transporter substrate-binding domain-containing protein [Anaeromicrobium sediminis]PAB61058.1 hypothetical protein CCE28_01110 [Anaeromicrobium sediminis]
MRKRIIGVLLMGIFAIVLFLNMYFQIEYEINLWDYFRKSKELTVLETQWLNEHKEIIYGADYNSPPLRFLNDENNQYKGLIVDYIRALSIELGIDIRLKPENTWNDALTSLEKKETHFFDMIPSKKREEKFLFSNGIYDLRGSILMSIDSKINNYTDLEGRKVAIPKGDYAIQFLQSRIRNIDFVFTGDIKEGIGLLEKKEVDAVVGDEPVLVYFLENYNLKSSYKVLDNPMYEKECSFAVSKDNKILLSILNKGIFSLKKKKIMARIQQKWFGMSLPFDKNQLGDKFGLIMCVFVVSILFIIYISYLWNKSLKEEVYKRTEELYKSKKDLQITFDGMSQLLLVVDKELVVSNVNKALCNLLKLNKREIIGKPYKSVIDNLNESNVIEMIKETFQGEKHHNKEIRNDGSIYEIDTFPLKNKSNNVTDVLIMIKDITRVKLIEKNMLQENKMAAIGQLAAGVAHEIRNPLGIIRNYSFLLKNEEIEKNMALEIIDSSVERASKIIDNLLNFSRMTSNTTEPVNICRFTSNLLNLERKNLEKNNVKCNIVCNCNLTIHMNQESLKYIFLNLIQNSIDAMETGGKIFIGCEEEDNKVTITFKDTGQGIKKEFLKDIFNPFFTTKEPGKGTGLGLYIVYSELKKIGGTISVESHVGIGTTFYITLNKGGAVNG